MPMAKSIQIQISVLTLDLTRPCALPYMHLRAISCHVQAVRRHFCCRAGVFLSISLADRASSGPELQPLSSNQGA